MCIDSHQTGFVGKGSDHLQLIKFWPYRAPGKGSAAGQKFLALAYYSQRAVLASPLSAFFIHDSTRPHLHFDGLPLKSQQSVVSI